MAPRLLCSLVTCLQVVKSHRLLVETYVGRVACRLSPSLPFRARPSVLNSAREKGDETSTCSVVVPSNERLDYRRYSGSRYDVITAGNRCSYSRELAENACCCSGQRPTFVVDLQLDIHLRVGLLPGRQCALPAAASHSGIFSPSTSSFFFLVSLFVVRRCEALPSTQGTARLFIGPLFAFPVEGEENSPSFRTRPSFPRRPPPRWCHSATNRDDQRGRTPSENSPPRLLLTVVCPFLSMQGHRKPSLGPKAEAASHVAGEDTRHGGLSQRPPEPQLPAVRSAASNRPPRRHSPGHAAGRSPSSVSPQVSPRFPMRPIGERVFFVTVFHKTPRKVVPSLGRQGRRLLSLQRSLIPSNALKPPPRVVNHGLRRRGSG